MKHIRIRDKRKRSCLSQWGRWWQYYCKSPVFYWTIRFEAVT